ncbi:DUF2235 domain-containing protein [Nocardia sp. NPDC050406]|uniref:DUF2235 domain-containing protein n=1 Tax=Nocardia sp. NPDC050406 TaxID=3364318 RepID=UPI00379F6A31
MKRLVVCCDGMWKVESTETVSNIVKIAHTIRFDARGPHGGVVNQSVAYVAGPGSFGYLGDRLMARPVWSGIGLNANLAAAYSHLVANWEPGDEIYLFGFSRGAYVARALAGLIDKVGIMTSQSVIDGRLGQALGLYRQRSHRPWDPPAWKEFRREHSHHPVKVDFLGVFETVGALGVPGLAARRHRFHDLRLPTSVRCARQALAIDERRRNFEPCLWETSIELNQKYNPQIPRIKQVWFEGVHADIGGGYEEGGLSDIALRWMAMEASQIGLVFDWDLLESLGADGRADGSRYYQRHVSLRRIDAITNVLRALRNPRRQRFYSDSSRRLYAPGAQGVRLASSVLDKPNYRPVNLERWRAEHDRSVPLPEESLEKTDAVLAGLASKSEEESADSGLMTDREVQVWSLSGDRAVIGTPTRVAFAVLVPEKAPAGSRERDPLPEPVALRVLVQSDEASVRPMTQVVVLDTDRTSTPIEFEVVPSGLGQIQLTYRIYQDDDGQFLQEVRQHLNVGLADRQTTRP